MRKSLIVSVAMLVTALGALGGEAAKATPLERVVPASAVAFVQAENLPALQKAFGQSALGKAVRQSRLLSYFEAVAGAAIDLGAVFATGLRPEEFRQALGGHVGLVLLDLPGRGQMAKNPPVLLLIEAADGPKLEGILKSQLELFTLLSNQPLVKQTQHAGTALYEVSPPNGRSFAYCFQGNVLILGIRATVTKLLDALAAGQPRLASDPTYRAVRQQLATPTGGLRGYVNVAAVMAKAGVAGRPQQRRILRILGVAELKGAGIAVDFVGSKVRDRIYLHTAAPSMGVLRFLTEGKPIAPTAAKFVPAHYTLLGSMAIQDVGIWDRLYRAIADAQGEAAANNMNAVANMVQQNLGVRVKEGFFDTFTDEMFFAIDLSKFGSFAGAGRPPAPQELPFIAGARLKNVPALLETANRIAANEALFERGIERVIKKHRGVDVATWTIPASPEIKPTYAIVDNTLLFSIRQEAVVQAIDAYKTNKNLAATLLANAPPAEVFPAARHYRITLNDGQLLAMLLDLIRAEVPTELHRFLPELDRVVKGLSGYHAVLRREAQGYSLTAVSDLGSLGTVVLAAVCFDQLNRVVARRVEADFDKFAAALEEYHAKHKAYPETLEQLVPDFLPNVVRDRFEPKRAYGYSRGQPGPDGQFPGAWVIISVGPDKKPNIPVEQFDPAAWTQRLQSDDPAQINTLKALIYQFRKDQFPDERKNDDEGDLVRLGGKAARKPTPKAPPPRPKPPKAPPAARPAAP